MAHRERFLCKCKLKCLLEREQRIFNAYIFSVNLNKKVFVDRLIVKVQQNKEQGKQQKHCLVCNSTNIYKVFS